MSAPAEASLPIGRRIVLHFPGFEPLDGRAHFERYRRVAADSARVWNHAVEVGPFRETTGSFDVRAAGRGWRVASRIHLLDHSSRIERYRDRPLAVRIAAGYAAAARVVAEGAAWRYFRTAWRFGLFFVFPFLLMAAGMIAAAAIACLPLLLRAGPWHLCWSLPLAAAFFRFVFLPFSERFHTLHLFSDWQMASALARLDDPTTNRLLGDLERRVAAALAEPADEILISSHSIGAVLATHIVGSLLEKQPDLFDGRRVAFVTLGGAVLQSGLFRSAGLLRARVGLIARRASVFWLDVQCLTDAVNFYRSRTFELCGHRDLPPAPLLLLRFKRMLDAGHYRRIKRDMLRVHRQYVLGPDRRADFDFTLLTAGPFPASSFAGFSPERPPPIGEDGALAPAWARVPAGA